MAKRILCSLMFFCHVLFSMNALADDYVMPASPMNQTAVQELLRELAAFVPVGQNTFDGFYSNGTACNETFYLDNDPTKIDYGFSFPGENLAFGFGGGDAVDFYLVSKTIGVDGLNDKTIHLAIVNRGGFGPDRMLVYDIVSKNGNPVSYNYSFANPRGAFFPVGQPIPLTFPLSGPGCTQLTKE